MMLLVSLFGLLLSSVLPSFAFTDFSQFLWGLSCLAADLLLLPALQTWL